MALISPVFNETQFFDNNGNPLAGGKIFQYEAGSNSVLKTTYTTQVGDVANPNPIVLDASGRLPGSTGIWLTSGELYNLVLTLSDGTSVLKSFDDVSGVVIPTPGPSGDVTVWVEQAATYLSPTSFLVAGNFTAQYAPGNRVRAALSGGSFTYGTVTSSSFGGGNTTVTILNDGVALNASLSRADYSALTAPGQTVDAAGVSYFSALNYTDPESVGYELKDLRADLTAEENQVNRLNAVWATSGSGANTPFAITPSPAATSYSADSTWNVRFVAAGAGNMTLNVSGLGAKRIYQYTAAGALTNAVIPAGTVSVVVYDSANDAFILQNRLPQTIPTPPRGAQVFTSNGTWTCPSNVFYAKVTCVGGGGGGGVGVIGARGGNGAFGVGWISVTPGSTYAVSVGAGGIGQPWPVGAGSATSGGTSSFGVTTVFAAGGGGATGFNGEFQGADAGTFNGNFGFSWANSFGAGPFGGYGCGGAAQPDPIAGNNGISGVVIVEF